MYCLFFTFIIQTILKFLGTTIMGNSMEVPQKTKHVNIILYSNLTPMHIYGEENNSKRYVHPNDHGGTIYNSQGMETT